MKKRNYSKKIVLRKYYHVKGSRSEELIKDNDKKYAKDKIQQLLKTGLTSLEYHSPESSFYSLQQKSGFFLLVIKDLPIEGCFPLIFTIV